MLFLTQTPRRPAQTARLAQDDVLPPIDEVEAWPVREVEVLGQRIVIRTTPATDPAAEPALLVHGLSGSALNWTDFAGLMRDRWASEAIDLPGHGHSGPARDDNYSLRAHADTVITYLEQSGRGPVHLVGNSMGGVISMDVARRRPDLVRTLTLVSPAVPDRKPRLYPLASEWRMGLLVVPVIGVLALRHLAAIAAEARVRGTLSLVFADPGRATERRIAEEIAETVDRSSYPWASTAVARSTRSLVHYQLARSVAGWAQMKAITVPTLVIWGDEDKLVAPDLAPFVAGAIPGARLLVLEHVGHVAMMEVPDVTARAVRAFISDLDGPPAGG